MHTALFTQEHKPTGNQYTRYMCVAEDTSLELLQRIRIPRLRHDEGYGRETREEDKSEGLGVYTAIRAPSCVSWRSAVSGKECWSNWRPCTLYSGQHRLPRGAGGPGGSCQNVRACVGRNFGSNFLRQLTTPRLARKTTRKTQWQTQEPHQRSTSSLVARVRRLGAKMSMSRKSSLALKKYESR